MGGSPFSGPPPKRSSERRRRNRDAVETTIVDLDTLIAGDVEIPMPPVRTHDEDGEELEEPEWVWHPQAMLLYDAAQRSGQAIFMEPSDWAALYVMCEQLHRALQPMPTVIGQDEDGKPIVRTLEIPMPGATLNAITKMMGSLMFLEGDRRKLRIELERKKQRDAIASGEGQVVSIVQKRSDLFREAQA